MGPKQFGSENEFLIQHSYIQENFVHKFSSKKIEVTKNFKSKKLKLEKIELKTYLAQKMD